MTILRVDDVSIAFTSFFMKLIGFWLAANRSEQRLRDVTLFYTMFAILFSLWVQTMDFYHSREDFGACLYNACNILSLTVPMFKILVLLVHKKKFFHLITYLERNFLHANYDKYETSVLASCKRKCTFFICFFIFLTEGTVFSYIVTPVIVNIGRNESDRTLPFNMWVDLPLSITPYYEIAFVIQVLCVYHIGLTYFCFDNFLCIMNIHLAGQFQILQYRVSNKCVIKHQEKSNLKLEKNSLKFINDCCATFKSYIRQHQILIAYCDQIEEIFNLIVLVQVITFSLLICLDGYQILVADVPHRKIIFFFHLMGTVCQLLMFTYSCDCIIQESRKLAPAVYSGPWLLLPMNENVQKLRKDLVMVIMRSHTPCCLTACKFFMVSLETYTKVLTTAASYFTLLQQSEDVNSSCDRIIRESMKLAPAAYFGPWLLLPISENGQKIKKDLVMVIMRSNVPCCLTGCGFFMVSLETYTKTNDIGSFEFLIMESKHITDISINSAIFYLKVMGIWFAVNRMEKCFRNSMAICSFISIVIIISLQFRGIYFCWEDTTLITSFACQAVALTLCLFKFCLVFIQRRKFLQLIEFMQTNFWHSGYDINEEEILANVRKMCIYFVCFFTFFSQLTLVCYVLKPAIINIGKDVSERMLIFPMWLDESWNKTPYYEIEYVIQILITFQGCVSYLCFDNIFCIMCLHAAGQFRILQYRIINIHKVKETLQDSKNANRSVLCLSDVCSAAFRDCIRQHQNLLAFCQVVDEVFRIIMLLQVFIFSILVCLTGYQLLLEGLNLSVRVSFVSLLMTGMCQLWVFTYSCNTMSNESISVTAAVYASPWIHLSMDKYGKMIRKDVQFVIMRSSQACHINAWRFFPISLETYTKIISTSMSYLTILRQSMDT
ncbi:uncharacterized protein LOC114874424 [Osmia bicornis bicornis]|uniref:uncharacterized protein LOC114874424 n=1 Tax=Osmia bicornis bicornis TaxID=1437191 RepID=UPI001EAEC661|nr:uncharacterized protein LOC114874424 [Osmia bicornis bicornis]